MVMDKGEILRSYNQALRKTEQVRILADLNACKPEEIIDVLVERGIDRQRLGRVIGNVRNAPERVPEVTLESREITVTEAVDRLRRELDELNRRQYELDMEKADFYRLLWEMLGGVS